MSRSRLDLNKQHQELIFYLFTKSLKKEITERNIMKPVWRLHGLHPIFINIRKCQHLRNTKSILYEYWFLSTADHQILEIQYLMKTFGFRR